MRDSEAHEGTVLGFLFKCRNDLSLVTGKVEKKDQRCRGGRKARSRMESMGEEISLGMSFKESE